MNGDGTHLPEQLAPAATGALRVLASALGAAGGAMLLVDPAGQVVAANREAERMLGGPGGGLLGARLDERILAYGSAGPCVAESLASGVRTRRVVSIARLGRAPVLARVRVSPAHDALGNVVGALVGLEEQTPEPDDVQTHRRAEASLRALMDNSPDPMVVHSGGRILYANPATARLLGYGSTDELMGHPVVELTYPEDRPVVRARIERMLRHDEAVPLNAERFLRKDGGFAWVDVVAFPVVFDGRLAMLVYGHDLTQRRAAEEERQRLLEEQTRLRSEAQRHASELQSILDHLSTGLFVVDREMRVVLTNRATAELYGIERSTDFLRPLTEVAQRFQPHHRDGRRYDIDELPLARALREGAPVEADLVIGKPDGTDRFVRVNASPIHDADGALVGAVAVLRDITDHVEFDRLKDQFLRVVAHELKTPVAIMKGYAQLLLRRPESVGDPRELLEKIDRGADRIDRIVQDMLDLSQLHLGTIGLELAPLDLTALVERVTAEVRAGLTRHRLHVALVPAEVKGDALRLAQVLRTLLDNAARYSPRGGDIDLEMGIEDGRVVVSVRDHGVGIPDDKQAGIFQRFFRAHTDTPFDYGGLGVALFIAREVVRRQGGEMWFVSREGQGSVFSFALPLRGRDAR